MKLKNCDQCGKPFPVIEPGDDPAQLDQGTTYLGAAVEICLDCHRKNENATPTKAELLARYGRDHSL